MPPKDSESLLDNVYFGVPSGDGGYEYKPIGEVEHVDITDASSMLPRPGEDMYGHFCKVKPGTTKLGWVAITELIWNGNSLYLRFPKKGKRKLRKHNRCKRLTSIRFKKWHPSIDSYIPEKIIRRCINTAERLYLGEQWSCSTCEYGPTIECGWNSACNNCLDGSNYWRKSDGD